MKINKIHIICLIILLLLTLTAAFLSAENYLYHRIYASAMVVDPEETAEALTAWVEGIGGYYTMKSTDYLVLRIPESKVYGLKEFLEENTDELFEFIPSAEDIRNEILFTKSAIESREEILTENLGYLNRTDVTGTLAIEQEVLDILKELEELKGRFKLLDQNRKFAFAEVALSFQAQSLPEKIPSSFEWLTGMDFYSFIQRGF